VATDEKADGTEETAKGEADGVAEGSEASDKFKERKASKKSEELATQEAAAAAVAHESDGTFEREGASVEAGGEKAYAGHRRKCTEGSMRVSRKDGGWEHVDQARRPSSMRRSRRRIVNSGGRCCGL
jgi:hypothetical protein